MHHRWHILRHPRYKSALKSLGLLSAETLTCEVKDDLSAVVDAYNIIQVPKQKSYRYARLHEVAKAVCDKGSQNSHCYRIAMQALTSVFNAVSNGAETTIDPTEHEPERTISEAGDIIPLAPKMLKRKHNTLQDLTNLASLSQQQQRKMVYATKSTAMPRHCSACKQPGHRKGNKFCPGCTNVE